MSENSIYIDEKTGNAIFAKKKENGSYSFYGTRKNDDGSFCINELEPINDIFDYIDSERKAGRVNGCIVGIKFLDNSVIELD